jgi:hypothetical protein
MPATVVLEQRAEPGLDFGSVLRKRLRTSLQ